MIISPVEKRRMLQPLRKLSFDLQNSIHARKPSFSGSSESFSHCEQMDEMKEQKDLNINEFSDSNDDEFSQKQRKWTKEGNAALTMDLSAMYGLLMVVLGLCFPLSSVISSNIPSSYYDGFYVYLYIVAIIFLLYVYTTTKQLQLPFVSSKAWFMRLWRDQPISSASTFENDACSTGYALECKSVVFNFSAKSEDRNDAAHHHGSFYLRSGAVVFGVGSMIYSGLDFGQYFELREDLHCQNILLALGPVIKAAFTFIQMYFVFLNSKMFRKRHPCLASFGLMHLVATNLCVWLDIIIQETKHEVLVFTEKSLSRELKEQSYKLIGSRGDGRNTDTNSTFNAITIPIERHKRGSLVDECHRTNIMGSIVQNASPFLFPCAIEYSLLCAAMMYEIWKNCASRNKHSRPNTPITSNNCQLKRSQHQYSVDCTSANKGLFLGIFIFVLCIISMIIFFVLISTKGYNSVAVTEILVAELILYTMTFCSVMLGVFQVRELRYSRAKGLELDNILIMIALAGVMTYSSFTTVGGYFGRETDSALVCATALCALVQASTQTLFILDASHRSAFTLEQQERKPGREVVTFLLVANFAMWAVLTMEKSRADAHLVQLEFFGLWPWTIITNVSMPLSIFYRYHSTVCLFEIWKRSYKIKASHHHAV